MTFNFHNNPKSCFASQPANEQEGNVTLHQSQMCQKPNPESNPKILLKNCFIFLNRSFLTSSHASNNPFFVEFAEEQVQVPETIQRQMLMSQYVIF